MIFNAAHGYLFVHIQKSAGTSITQALANQPGSCFVAPAHLRLRDVAFSSEKQPFTFAVVRNPWERLVSWYSMMLRKGVHNDFSRYLLSGSLNFSEFLRRINVIVERASDDAHAFMAHEGLRYRHPGVYLKSLGFAQTDYLTDRWGRFRCDRVLRFEHLQEEWTELLATLHPGTKIDLPHANAKPDGPLDWRSHFTCQEDIDWVSHVYRKDIRRFGYTFE